MRRILAETFALAALLASDWLFHLATRVEHLSDDLAFTSQRSVIS